MLHVCMVLARSLGLFQRMWFQIFSTLSYVFEHSWMHSPKNGLSYQTICFSISRK